ncbi:Caffeoylshikimate esterase [Vitis vinifera]|uniref:Caffeoylshikimate esterase n=1 Tax=Vitis vinifera TaxID=29760 RepID=A0A438CX63_VITVI|nr:Caffeoylshikimate esterase [Vitis vinifera]
MAHPVHQANENSPFGNLTREEFYKKHHVLHQEGFMLNSQNMKIFTQSWCPDSTLQPKGLVAMVHGYTSESSWLFGLTAVAIAKAGFFVYALDLQGHGYSEGLPGNIPDIQPIVCDCIQYFDSARANHPKLPAFLYGDSAKFKPVWPLEKLLPVAAFFAPNWRIVISKPLASKSYKEEWKRKLVAKSPNRHASGKPPAATALEFLRVCDYISRHCHELEVPMLVVHGEDDMVCASDSARTVYELAASKDKTLNIFPGMWHQLIGEPKEGVELVFGTILSWIGSRAEKAKANTNRLYVEQ